MNIYTLKLKTLLYAPKKSIFSYVGIYMLLTQKVKILFRLNKIKKFNKM